MVVMIAGIHISQEIFTIDELTALKSSLEQHRKHVLRLLPLYEDITFVCCDCYDYMKTRLKTENGSTGSLSNLFSSNSNKVFFEITKYFSLSTFVLNLNHKIIKASI